MQCPKCSDEISDQAIFCTNCGLQIKISCSKCGANSWAGAKFCSQCGSRLSHQVHSDLASQQKSGSITEPSPETHLSQTDPYERRVVTILFADIAGFSTLSEKIDPEKLAEIMSGAYPCLLEPIQEFYGSIEQVMGDGVLAYFGTPLAQEDDPERAVLAGLEIITRIQTYAKKLQKEAVVDNFQVRVGINTGLVVVGEMNQDEHLEYLALGDAVNLAARLQQNAPNDGVLISYSTYQQVRGLFDVQQQAPLVVKGREQVEHTYLVQRRKPDHLRKRKRGLEGVATSMIGREPEMAALKNTYKDVIHGGETALVLVSGDPGIGKTRLINEFAGWVTSQPNSPILMRGRAISELEGVPYGVLRYLFARSFGIRETDTSAQALEKFRKGTQQFLEIEQGDLIGQLVGFDFKVSPTIHQLLGSTSFSEISELYLKNYFRSLAEKSLLIILEDLHWMDVRTLDFFSDLMTELSSVNNLQLMILCTARTQFLETRPKWGEGIQGFIEIKLKRLSHRQSRSLINKILFKADKVPEIFYQTVVDEAGGNPFFIEEIIRMFFDEKVIEGQDGSLKINPEKLEDLHVPPTLKGILQTRLDSLSLSERQLVQRAAIIGRTFWDGLVRVLTEDEVERQEINLRLEMLRNRGLIYHRELSSIADNQEYIFKHALLRDVAYETVLLKHRQRYHKHVAIWIEQNAGDRLDEHLALIANHYLDAGEKDLAADWFIKAGKRALAQSLMQEAKYLFEKALNLTDEENIQQIWEATLGHDEAVGALGELDARHADDIKLLNLAKQLENEKLLAEAYYRSGSQAYNEGNNQEALRFFELAMEIADRNGNLKMQAEILPMKIAVLSREGDLDAAGSLVEDAQALARETKNANVIARALNNIAIYYQMVGDISQSVQLMKEQIEINQQQGNRMGETFGMINLGYFYLSIGHFEASQSLLERALMKAQRLSARICIAYSLLNLGLAEWRLGRSQKACEVLNNSKEFLEALSDHRGLASQQFYLGLSCESATDLSQAAEHFTHAIKLFKTIGATNGLIEAQAGMARLALKGGDAHKAQSLAFQIIEYLDQEGSYGLELPILTYLTCINVFDALKDQDMVEHGLKGGLKEMRERLAMIHEADWKEVFLEEIPENRELLEFSKRLPNYTQ